MCSACRGPPVERWALAVGCGERVWRTRRWCTSIVDVTGGQLLDMVPGRDAQAPIGWLLDQPQWWRDDIKCGDPDWDDRSTHDCKIHTVSRQAYRKIPIIAIRGLSPGRSYYWRQDPFVQGTPEYTQAMTELAHRQPATTRGRSGGDSSNQVFGCSVLGTRCGGGPERVT